MALVKAARRFDPSRGEFGVFASVSIIGELKRHLRDLSWSVRPPRAVQELGSEIAYASAEIANDEGHAPAAAKLASVTGRTVVEVREAIRARGCRRASSLDQPGPVGTRTLGDTLVDTGAGFARFEDRLELSQLCEELSAEDIRLLTLRYFDGLTQREIARVIGSNQMSVSRRLAFLLRTLRAKADRQDAA